MAHPRLRRSSSISMYAAAAALEAIGHRLERVQAGQTRLGVVFTTLTGCVSYSRRFYDEVLKDPATASPIVFPETVFNAPASHLATYLNSNAINYTLIGDPGTFLQGLALAGEWLMDGRIDLCVVVGAEELDWLVAAAQHLFNPDVIVSEGAGAVVLERSDDLDSDPGVRLDGITEPATYTAFTPPGIAAKNVQEAIGTKDDQSILFTSLTGVRRFDRAESDAWAEWSGARLSVKPVLGESFAAGSAWQCVLAADQVSRGLHPSAIINVVGCNQQAIAARFARQQAAD
jgi:3-oxoacyl-(acyl-carrier-protein) synthase